MSKDLFTPVNYDAIGEAPVKAEQVSTVRVAQTPEEAVEIINAELTKIPLGTSKLVPHAVQIREGSTPFLVAVKTFLSDPSLEQALALVSLAHQDFGHTFGLFVKATVSPLFVKGSK